MGWRVRANWNKVYYLQAEHDYHPDIFAKEEHLVAAVDYLHAQAVKYEYKGGDLP